MVYIILHISIMTILYVFRCYSIFGWVSNLWHTEKRIDALLILQFIYLFINLIQYNNGYRIRGFCDGRMFVVHLGCKYSPQILANVFLHGQGRGWGHVILRGIFILANCEKHCIRVSENTTQYPRILISIGVTWSRLFLSVCKYILILILNSILII